MSSSANGRRGWRSSTPACMALRSAPRSSDRPEAVLNGTNLVPSEHCARVLQGDAPYRRVEVGVDPQGASTQQGLPGVRAEEFPGGLVGHLAVHLLEHRRGRGLLSRRSGGTPPPWSCRPGLPPRRSTCRRSPARRTARGRPRIKAARVLSPSATRRSLTSILSVCNITYHQKVERYLSMISAWRFPHAEIRDRARAPRGRGS